MVPFDGLDEAALGRSLAQIADRPDDIADLFLERSEEIEVSSEVEDPGFVVCREQGLAVRLLRGGLSWLSAQDGLTTESVERAFREAARALPAAAYSRSQNLAVSYRDPVEANEVQAFPALVKRMIRGEHAAFPFALKVRRHRRWIRVLGPRLVTDTAAESYYSLLFQLPWGRHGRLLASLDEGTAGDAVAALLERLEAREAPPPPTGSGSVVLGAAATAVLLHEAVAHALEADTLVLGGRPEAACGYQLGSRELNVLDDPAGAPESIARQFDDEGVPVSRRWLLQQGEVREPLADQFFARSSEILMPGAARRSSRHSAPGPRSSHLELAPGTARLDELLVEARGGLFLAEADAGWLDPVTGELELRFPWGRKIEKGELGAYVGPCRITGQLSTVLSAVAAVGSESLFAGAGWCAKNGQRLPVWATCPPVLLEDVEISA